MSTLLAQLCDCFVPADAIWQYVCNTIDFFVTKLVSALAPVVPFRLEMPNSTVRLQTAVRALCHLNEQFCLQPLFQEIQAAVKSLVISSHWFD